MSTYTNNADKSLVLQKGSKQFNLIGQSRVHWKEIFTFLQRFTQSYVWIFFTFSFFLWNHFLWWWLFRAIHFCPPGRPADRSLKVCRWSPARKTLVSRSPWVGNDELRWSSGVGLAQTAGGQAATGFHTRGPSHPSRPPLSFVPHALNWLSALSSRKGQPGRQVSGGDPQHFQEGGGGGPVTAEAAEGEWTARMNRCLRRSWSWWSLIGPSTLLYHISLLLGWWNIVQNGDPLYGEVNHSWVSGGHIWPNWVPFFAKSTWLTCLGGEKNYFGS